jgi:hypothetical protein
LPIAETEGYFGKPLGVGHQGSTNLLTYNEPANLKTFTASNLSTQTNGLFARKVQFSWNTQLQRPSLFERNVDVLISRCRLKYIVDSAAWKQQRHLDMRADALTVQERYDARLPVSLIK